MKFEIDVINNRNFEVVQLSNLELLRFLLLQILPMGVPLQKPTFFCLSFVFLRVLSVWGLGALHWLLEMIGIILGVINRGCYQKSVFPNVGGIGATLVHIDRAVFLDVRQQLPGHIKPIPQLVGSWQLGWLPIFLKEHSIRISQPICTKAQHNKGQKPTTFFP